MESTSTGSVRPQREWRLRTELEARKSGLPHLIEELRADTGLSPVTLRVCVSRGLDSSQAILSFLSPRLENLTDPFWLKDMDVAVARLGRARAEGEHVRIFGDYDVDGTAASALLVWYFRESGIRHDVRQPDRFKDGYGLNVRAVEEAAADGVRLLVTVDCGITNFDAADRARELGIDLIIVDHHLPNNERGLPDACAVIDPHRSDCTSGLGVLCGCGLAFYLARALRTRGRDEGWWTPGSEPNLKQHLDLVVMATAADLVPLTGDNHILVRHGMDVLKHSRKPGVKALLESSGIGTGPGREISPSHLGFVLGPRINASGRMSSASIALELLTATEPSRAATLAQDLERLNEERQAVQNRIWDQVRQQIEEGLAQGRFKNGIVVADTGWHEGVVGIVASRVVEAFRRPAAVIALREDCGKGSVRSSGGKDVLAALRVVSSRLMAFGGHKHAAGLTVALDQVADFAREWDEALGRLAGDQDAAPLWIEGTCAVDDFDVRTLEEIERLGPFGPGNPEPVFALRAFARNPQTLKGRHLKLNLAGQARAQMDAIWFHGAEAREQIEQLAEESEWAGVPELNRFRGRVTPTLRVKDWRPTLPN